MGSADATEVSGAGRTDEYDLHSAVESRLHTGADSGVAVESIVPLSEADINEDRALGVKDVACQTNAGMKDVACQTDVSETPEKLKEETSQTQNPQDTAMKENFRGGRRRRLLR